MWKTVNKISRTSFSVPIYANIITLISVDIRKLNFANLSVHLKISCLVECWTWDQGRSWFDPLWGHCIVSSAYYWFNPGNIYSRHDWKLVVWEVKHQQLFSQLGDNCIPEIYFRIYGLKFSFTVMRERRHRTWFVTLYPRIYLPKWLYLFLPILFTSVVLSHKTTCNQRKCDVINDIELFSTLYHWI